MLTIARDYVTILVWQPLPHNSQSTERNPALPSWKALIIKKERKNGQAVLSCVVPGMWTVGDRQPCRAVRACVSCLWDESCSRDTAGFMAFSNFLFQFPPAFTMNAMGGNWNNMRVKSCRVRAFKHDVVCIIHRACTIGVDSWQGAIKCAMSNKV